MCGLVAITSRDQDVTENLLKGLERLEYRGYDSTGIGGFVEGRLERRRAAGRVQALREVLKQNPLHTQTGIAHTRWATHGGVTPENAHPQGNENILVVHNGIIENFASLKKEAIAEGYSLESQTDTELLVFLLDRALRDASASIETLPQIVRQALKPAKGSFACVFLLADFPDLLIGFRQGHSPLAFTQTTNHTALGSDAMALAGLGDTLAYLEDGDIALLDPNSAAIWDQAGKGVTRPAKQNFVSLAGVEKGGFTHHMHKEIYEQPHVLNTLAETYITPEGKLHFPELPISFKKLKRLNLVGCGSAYYAGCVARYWFEALAGLPTTVTYASEVSLKPPCVGDGEITLCISQSGETADTLKAFSHLRSCQDHMLALVNTPHSSLDRLADFTLYTHAGTEVAVASTKAFMAQIFVLGALALLAAHEREHISPDILTAHLQTLRNLPAPLMAVLSLEQQIMTLAQTLQHKLAALYLGRGLYHPIAQEGALKLKEIAYTYAMAYPAGELKHGPIALVEAGLPIIFLAPSHDFWEKNLSNIQEIKARDGELIVLTDAAGAAKLRNTVPYVLVLPESDVLSGPFVTTVALQLLAYHTSLLKGYDVDKPRNLAKSVTVE